MRDSLITIIVSLEYAIDQLDVVAIVKKILNIHFFTNDSFFTMICKSII
jgi:hypothetical protein